MTEATPSQFWWRFGVACFIFVLLAFLSLYTHEHGAPPTAAASDPGPNGGSILGNDQQPDTTTGAPTTAPPTSDDPCPTYCGGRLSHTTIASVPVFASPVATAVGLMIAVGGAFEVLRRRT